MDHSHLLSDVMQLRQPSFVATFGQIAKEIPDAIMLSVGSPNATLFPFKEMTLTMRNGQDITVDEFMMKKCLQYGSAKGFEPLLEQLKILTKKLHEPPQWENKDIVVLAGSQMGIGLVFEMLVNPEDFVITPEPTYPGIFNALQPLPHQLVSVTCDSEGVRPDDLKDVLEKCRSSSKGKPKVMYVNPSGNNPTGVVWSESRRRLVYEIACQYDIIILEDDPYYLLEFSETLTPSFLHLDSENRVMRLDSFSKTVSAGIRLGYATGSKDLIEKLRLLVMCTINHASLVAQACVSQMLETVGIDGFLRNGREVAKFYKNKRDIAIKAAEKHMKNLCEWIVPAGGMFLWIKVRNIADTKKLILGRGYQKGFLAMPGVGSLVNQNQSSQYLRVSYSDIDQQKVDEGFKLLAELIKEEIKEGKNVVKE